jgi:hypothetical protein
MTLNETLLKLCLKALNDVKIRLCFGSEGEWEKIIKQIEEIQKLNNGDFEFKMRNPKRIKVVLDEIGNAWRCTPDSRLGQLLINAASKAGIDLYQIEDEQLAANVFKLLRESSKMKE